MVRGGTENISAEGCRGWNGLTRDLEEEQGFMGAKMDVG